MAAAIVAVVASFSVMASVMNLAGYVAVGRGHHEGDIFTMISVHILGMYGLVLIVGDIVDRFGRRRTLVTGLALMALSNMGLIWLGGLAGMSIALLGLLPEATQRRVSSVRSVSAKPASAETRGTPCSS